MTSLEQERTEQRRWADRLKRPVPVYDAPVEGEFESPEYARDKQAGALNRMLRFSSQCVPHYRDLFRRVGVDPAGDEPMSVLGALPILRKLDVHDNETALHAELMPPKERVAVEAQSSGTTGPPTKLRHSMLSARMFLLLKQREYRWFRFDPAGKLAVIRFPGQLPRIEGRELAHGETLHLPAWIYLAEDFSTGPCVAFDVTNPAERQIAWLREHRADYLLTFSENLEQLGFAAGSERPSDRLKGVVGISDQLTPAMRAHVERSFGVPVWQNYGLNEIGLVAARCEAGRYHVHSEHCIVEIIGSDGRASMPGETGRIVVTGLTNWAMPLLRYDSDDLAKAVDDACPCGRTLPSFGDVVGRYSRVAFLPDGTLRLVEALRIEVELLPADLVRDVRQYQIHQYRDNSFEFRILSQAPMPALFEQRMRGAWLKAGRPPLPPLEFKQVATIARSPGGKFQSFTSDFMPVADSAEDDSTG